MRFVFRNNTIEPFFDQNEYTFSGYGDISRVPDDADGFLWFYQLPLLPNGVSLAKEVRDYADKLHLVAKMIPATKPLFVFTLVNTFHSNVVENNQELDDSIIHYNAQARSIAIENHNVKIIRFEDFCARYNISDLIDWKFWFISQMPLSPKLAAPFKAWWKGKMQGLALKRKKCLVLDLDNTLWGGILGEDGIEGIKIGGDYPGKAFVWWQNALLELSKTGVILTVCSKNNEEDVKELWAKNPFLLLTEQNFATWRINWQDKVTNIQEIAKELNIGLDSLVFVDDNPTERELVRQLLPMVEVPEFPVQPYGLPAFFNRLVEDFFQAYSTTTEDIDKTAQYKANAQRLRQQADYADFDDYLKSLDINISVDAVNDFNLPRIAQMTQKTNQFNLTTRRYTEADILKRLNEGWKIWCMSVSDKFGDNGITGCIMVDGYMIDTLLLSCRILGKKIEFEFVKVVLALLKDSGLDYVEAAYIPTAKNSQVADFYDRCGFNLISDAHGIKKYSISLRNANLNLDAKYQFKINQ